MNHQDHQEPAAKIATHLIHRHHADGEDDYADQEGTCCFCGVQGPGVSVDDAVSHKYFSDYALMATDTGHVCESCAYCMNTRELKQGHWIVSSDTYESVSTGDLFDLFRDIRDGKHDPPIAVHISENPIRSEHAYLWTPATHRTDPLTASYSRQTARFEWDTFDQLLDAVEELRRHGFRGDDIRSGEPRVRDLESVGADRYRELDRIIDPHRRTPLLDIVWTVSRSKDDQPAKP